MSEQKITLKDALGIVVRQLENIKVPIAFYDEIGTPIRQAVSNLKICLNAQMEAPAEPEEEPVSEEAEN